MPWIGLDDTDTLSGGCTTYEFHRLITLLENLSSKGSPWKIEDPRLVRLWPFAAKRTRGNAALAVRIDIEIEYENILFDVLGDWFRELKNRISKFEVIQGTHSDRKQFMPEPCLLYVRKQIPEYYWEAVRQEVSPMITLDLISGLKGTKYWILENKISGLVGSLAAISWTGELDFTWELTAYRLEENYNTPRKIIKEYVDEISKKFPSTILNRDPTKNKSLISPNTPCPVLYGIRSEREIDAKLAHTYLQSKGLNEKSSSYQIWRTNQATGDHIGNIYRGMILSKPKIIRGGHVILNVNISGLKPVKKELLAFKESGNVRKLAEKLMIGDQIQWEGLKSLSNNIHLEKLRLIQPVLRDLRRPLCDCGSKYVSLGKNKPLICKKCNLLSPRTWHGKSLISLNWVEPEASQRRHLAKPINRKNMG